MTCVAIWQLVLLIVNCCSYAVGRRPSIETVYWLPGELKGILANLNNKKNSFPRYCNV